MAEYNPSKIIKDGNTYNFRDTTKIPLAGSNAISGDLIPATDNAIDIGSSTKNLKMLYTKGITIDNKTIDTDANGNLVYDGHIVDTIEEQGDGYIRYSNGIQICWSDTGVGREVIMNFPKSFLQRPAISATGDTPDTSTVVTAKCTNQTITIYCNYEFYGGFYIAIGRWK